MKCSIVILYNSHHKLAVEETVKNNAADAFENITINDVAMNRQKKGRSAGQEGLCMESFIYIVHKLLCVVAYMF